MNPEQEEAKRLAEFINDAHLGEQAQKFLSTDIGRCIAKHGLDKREAARSKLETCDPKDAVAILRLQLEAKAAQLIFEPLAAAILAGEQAKETIKREGELNVGETGSYQY